VPAKADPGTAAPLPEEPPAPRDRRPPRLARRVLPPLLFSLVVLGAWQAYSELADVNPLLLPSPLAVAQSVVDNAALFADNAVVTLQEILIGFVLGAAAGIGLAVLPSPRWSWSPWSASSRWWSTPSTGSRRSTPKGGTS
jgi:hypothetical protein